MEDEKEIDFLDKFFYGIFFFICFPTQFGDYRTIKSGDWNDTIWEKFSLGMWKSSTNYPTSGSVFIMSGYTVTIPLGFTVNSLGVYLMGDEASCIIVNGD